MVTCKMTDQERPKHFWLMLAAVITSMFLCGTLTSGGIAVLTNFWTKRFALQPNVVAWAASINGGSFMLTCPLNAMLLRAIGLWRIQIIAAVVSLTGSFALAFSTEFWQIVICYGFLQGYAASILHLASTDAVNIFFTRHKDKVFAGLILSFGLSMMVTPTLMELLIDKLSYRWALIIFALPNIMSVFTVLLYYLIIQKDGEACEESEQLLEPEKIQYGTNESEADRSNKIGNLDDVEPAREGEGRAEGMTDLSEESMRRNVTEQTSDTSETTERKSILKSHIYVLSDPVFVVILCYVLVGGIGESGFHTFPVSYATQYKILTLKEAALGITLLGISTCLGSLTMVVISHWNYDKFAMAFFSSLLLGCISIVVGLSRSKWLMYLAFVAFGYMDGCWLSNGSPWISSYFNEPEFLTVRMSYVFFFNGLSAVIGPIAGGYFIKNVGLEFVYFFYGATCLCGALIIFPCFLKIKLNK